MVSKWIIGTDNNNPTMVWKEKVVFLLKMSRYEQQPQFALTTRQLFAAISTNVPSGRAATIIANLR